MTEQLIDYETAVLARKKGFDEICRNLWMSGEDGPIAVDAPTDEVLIGGFLSLFVKYKDDPSRFIQMLEKRIPKPLRNATLPDVMLSRPTQDLLERWLREKHRIMPCQLVVQNLGKVSAYRAVVIEMDDIHLDTPLPTIEYTSFELAREAALQHALNLLP